MLAEEVLKHFDGEIKEIHLNEEVVEPLNRESLTFRDQCISLGDFGNGCFDYAREFALPCKKRLWALASCFVRSST